MGLTGIPFQMMEVPFAQGLKTKDDPRALQPPGLSICRDAEFDDVGALRPRKPYAAVGVNILGGGTLSNVRRVFSNGSELCCFTDTALYSWDSRDSVWIKRSTHLAVAMAEATMFATMDDQRNADRAELGGTIVYVWDNGTTVYSAAIDKVTGATIQAPRSLGTGTRPRLVACTTKILCFYADAANGLQVSACDPANVDATIIVFSTVTNNVTFNSYYDVTRVIGADTVIGAHRNQTTTAHTVFKVTAALAITTSSKARACTGPIAVSSTPDGTSMQVARYNNGAGDNIQGDLLVVSSLADTFTAQAIGTSDSDIDQLTCAHRSVQNSGAYRCYVFWTSSTTTYRRRTQYNWVDTGNTLGAAAQFIRTLTVASRAFDYNGSVFVWLAFGDASSFDGDGKAAFYAQLQNSFFLWRDDVTLHAKAVCNRGGGMNTASPGPGVLGYLPGVALTAGSTTFSVCLAIRRRIPIGPGTAAGVAAPGSASAMRSPQDVTFTYDSNDARRTARLGRTVYVAAGEVLQYDGAQLAEVGFHYAPYYFDAFRAAGGNLVTGTYAYKQTYRWLNGQGEIDRSSSMAIGTVTIAAGPQQFTTSEWYPARATHKTNGFALPAMEQWRTPVNPTADSPFYLVSSVDPGVVSNPNRYVPADPTLITLISLIDQEADSTSTSNNLHPENGGVLQSLAPPSASIILVNADRVFLGNVAGDPDRLWYSKNRADGEVAAFNDGLVIPVPKPGGAMTGLAFNGEVLTCFRQHAVYAIAGDGYDNVGGGTNYGPARLIASDVGAVNPDAIATTPGGLIFKSSKGWYTIDHGFNVQYIGKDVAKFDSDTIYAVHAIESQHQIRCITSARCLVYDYLVGEWSEWTIADGLHACLWNGTYVYAATGGPKQEQATFAGVDYGMDVELAYLKPLGLQGRALIRDMMILGEFRSACGVRVRVSRDYIQDGAGNPTYFDDVAWDATPAVVGSALQVSHNPSQQRCQSIKVRITACLSKASKTSPPTGEAFKLTGIAFDVGSETGMFPGLPTTQNM